MITTTFHRAVGAQDLAVGAARTVDIEGKKIAVVHAEGRFYAVDALCTHMGVPLDKGGVDGHELVCPWHAARFCVRTGAKTSGPGFCDLDTYPVRVVNGFVEVGLESEVQPVGDPLAPQPAADALRA